IKNLQNSLGVTAISVTHDQSEALSMSDIIAIMNGGEVVQIGPPAELYERPANRFVAEFLGGGNLFEEKEYNSSGGICQATISGGIRVPCHVTQYGVGLEYNWLGVRPERVRLVDPKSEASLFTARIAKQTYMGECILCDLILADGVTFSAKIPIESYSDLP